MTISDEMKKARQQAFKPKPDITVGGITYSYVPGRALGRHQGLYVARKKYQDGNGPMVNVNWFGARNIAGRAGGRIPTNFEWSRTRKYAELADPGLEQEMITWEEWTDTAVNFTYQPPVATNRPGITDEGNKGYRLIGGPKTTIAQLPELPSGGTLVDIEAWDDETELPVRPPENQKSGRDKFHNANISLDNHKAWVVVLRGYASFDDEKNKLSGRFSVQMVVEPDFFGDYLGFRTVIDEELAA